MARTTGGLHATLDVVGSAAVVRLSCAIRYHVTAIAKRCGSQEEIVYKSETDEWIVEDEPSLCEAV
jgi:hypothetical protein